MPYFLVYLLLEVLVSVNIASAIGGLATFFEILLSALIGIVILSNFRATLSENIRAVSSRQIDMSEFQSLNLFTIAGAILLIIPGFLTDIIGILLQFGVFTKMIVNRTHVKSQSNKSYPTQNTTQNTIQKDSDVIDVEIIDTQHTSK
ncbi:MAG: FxsA family protein [Sulfurimonas sp.]|nr:FxsA family protein [Sulfurimonas sp.]MDD5202724.1 FxsA family protein [Sulfurimonas sp.]